MSQETVNPFEEQVKEERKKSSVKDFANDQEKARIRQIKHDMDIEKRQQQLVERAERRKQQEEEFRAKKQREKVINKENKQKLKQQRKEQRFESIKESHRGFQRRQFEKKVKRELEEEKRSKDFAVALGRGLGFHNEGRTLTPRERLERQIAKQEKKLQRLRTKLLEL